MELPERRENTPKLLYGHLSAEDGPLSRSNAVYSAHNMNDPAPRKQDLVWSSGGPLYQTLPPQNAILDNSVLASSETNRMTVSDDYSHVESPKSAAEHTEERLISIDDGNNQDLLVPPLCETEAELQAQITKLKARSTQKFVSAWEKILQKYSNIDDEKESDEIDLATGEIVTDNGHLRSLTSHNASLGDERLQKSIWSGEYNPERDMGNRKVVEKLRQRLKQAARMELKRKLLFYNEAPLSTPEKDEVRPDNLVLLSPSPSKKTKLSPTKAKAFQSDISADSTDNSPTKLHLSRLSLGGFLRLSTPVEEMTSDTGPSNPLKGSPVKRRDMSFRQNTNSFKKDHIALQSDILDGRPSSPVHLGSALEVSFDEEYLFTSDIYAAEDDLSLFKCAFANCETSSTSKRRYERHLLEFHSEELQNLGYPVNSTTNDDIVVSETEKGRLTKVFPLVHDVPQLPLSIDGGPFACKCEVGKGRKCQKTFVSAADLKEHRLHYPIKCSYKKQVHLCPLLGCGFMTDEGYLQWRQHFIDEMHHIDPRFKQKERRNVLKQLISLSKTDFLGQGQDDVADDIDTLFSDVSRSPVEGPHADFNEEEHSKAQSKSFPEETELGSDESKNTFKDTEGYTNIHDVISEAKSEFSISLLAPRPFRPRPILHDVPKLSLEPMEALEKEVSEKEVFGKDQGYDSIDELFAD